ncbi:hypothetical protein ABZ412_10875 [Nocardia sp. NPDC005746]|uniref:hypothetical protein n=1 Tax=Nocardia sp. NPDC005746 TaxID=3157062 RepID=UPI0033CF964F
MGLHQAKSPVRPAFRRAAAYAVAGALPLSLSLLSTAPALAEEPAPAVQPAAPIPDSSIRIGTMKLDQPFFLTPEQTQQINDTSASAESVLAQALEAVGVDHARATYTAKTVITDSLIGASVGATAVSPIAATGALIGVVAGLVAGLPFAPIGLVIVPVFGAAVGYAMVAAPFAALGAGVGAAVGAAEGLLTAPPAAPAS